MIFFFSPHLKNLRLVAFFLCLPSLLFLNFHVCYAENNSNAPDLQLESKLKRNRIEKNILAHQQRIKQTQTQEFNLRQELQRLDNLLRKGQKNLTNLQQTLLRQESHLQAKEQEITIIQTEKEDIERHVKKRIKAFYQTGDMAFINTIFSATTLPDLLNIEEYFQALFHYDKQIINQYRTKINLLQGAKNTIITEKEKILTTISQARDQENEIIESRLQREKLLVQVKTEETLYRQALTEMENASAVLAKKIQDHKVPTITNPKKKITRLQSSKKKKPLPETGFAAKKGYLPPPTKDGHVFRVFGPFNDSFGTEINSSGFDFVMKEGDNVLNVADGKVIYTGQIAGYGTLVIIDHELQYFTLVSNLNNLLVTKGDFVKEGDILGVYSGRQQLQGTGIHFEIRQGSKALDPLLWLDQDKLTIDVTEASLYIENDDD